MILQKLHDAHVIHPPNFLISGCAYLSQMGSVAYGVSGESSDVDIYGFCVPNRDLVFPHLAGEVLGFGRQIQRFEQWQEHHVVRPDVPDTTYDFSVYSIVKYFQLCMDNNPNMIDSLFTPRRCVLHSTQIGELVREHRKMFLHKGAYHKFRGYAYAQLSRYKTAPQHKVQEVLTFCNTHSLPIMNIVYNIQCELSRRGIVHAKFNSQSKG